MSVKYTSQMPQVPAYLHNHFLHSFPDGLMQDKPYRPRNINRKGKAVSRLIYPLKTTVSILHCFELIFTDGILPERKYILHYYTFIHWL